jgi:DNA-binding MarR family transcriptional regulator
MRITEGQRRTLREWNNAIRRVDGEYDRVARVAGLSPNAFDILYTLYAEGEGCSQRELCERCYSNKQTVNSTVHRLAEQGVVSLGRTGSRSSCVELTPQGRRLAEAVVDPVARAELASLESRRLARDELARGVPASGAEPEPSTSRAPLGGKAAGRVAVGGGAPATMGKAAADEGFLGAYQAYADLLVENLELAIDQVRATFASCERARGVAACAPAPEGAAAPDGPAATRAPGPDGSLV